MNVFEFLGLSADHRAINKVVQLVKHFDDVNKKADEGVYHKKVKFPMYAQCKKDGVFAMVVVLQEEAKLFGCTGKHLKSCERLEDYYKTYPVGVYLAELCNDDCSLEVLSGIVNPNRVNELDNAQALIASEMKLYFHDYLSIGSFINGYTPSTYLSRYYVLRSRICNSDNLLSLAVIDNEKQLRDYAEHMICCGQEGAVFKQDVEWLAGAKDWHSMKIVRGVSYDLECIGYEEGTGKYTGLVANLILRWKDGKQIKAMLGKGWTHVMAKQMFLDTHPLCEQSPIGKIFEVYALQESSKGVLRLPKTGELRHDKTAPDF